MFAVIGWRSLADGDENRMACRKEADLKSDEAMKDTKA